MTVLHGRLAVQGILSRSVNPPTAWRWYLDHRLAAFLADVVAHQLLMLLPFHVLTVVDPVHEQPQACPAPDPPVEFPAHLLPLRTQSGIRTRTTILLGDVPPADWATWAQSLFPDSNGMPSPYDGDALPGELKRQAAGGSDLILDAIADPSAPCGGCP